MPKTFRTAPVAEAEILIDAPAARIWDLMTGFARYGEWNPFIVKVDLLDAPGFAVSGLPTRGDRVRLRLEWENGRRGQSAELVETVRGPGAGLEAVPHAGLAADPEAGGPPTASVAPLALLTYRFDGFLARTGLVRALRTQELYQESTPQGPRVRYRTREEFHGLLAAFVPLDAVRRAFAIHAGALKKAGEAPAHGTHA